MRTKPKARRKRRALTEADVTFTLTVEQDDTPVRGNALASGDDAEDRACEDAIIARLENGDAWAWASVLVRATWRRYGGEDYLGACSYADEAAFAASGYLADMRHEALARLNEAIDRAEKDCADVRAGRASP